MTFLLPAIFFIVSGAIKNIYFESRYLNSQLTKEKKRRIYYRTFRLWLAFPFVAFLGGLFLYFANKANSEAVESKLYSLKWKGPAVYACGASSNLAICKCDVTSNNDTSNINSQTKEECPEDSYAITRLKKSNSKIQSDVHFAIDRVFNTFENDILQRVIRGAANLQNTEQSAKQATMTELFYGNESKIIFKRHLWSISPLLKPSECAGIGDWISKTEECVSRRVLKPLNTSYEKEIRPNIHEEILSFLNTVDHTTSEGSDELKYKVTDILGQRIKFHREKTHKQAKTVFHRLNQYVWISWIMWAITVMIGSVFGFLYIFLRYTYDPKEGGVPFYIRESDLIGRERVVLEPLLKSNTVTDFEFCPSQKTWYISIPRTLGVKTTQKRKRVWIHQGSWLINRFPFRLWFREFQGLERGGSPIKFSIPGGSKQITRVVLEKNSTVYVEPRRVLGLTSNLTLRTILSFRAAFLLSKSPILKIIEGPGEFLIVSNWTQVQKPPSKADSDSLIHVSPEELVLLDIKKPYGLEYDHDWKNVYFDDHSLLSDDINTHIRSTPNDGLATFMFNACNWLRRALFLPLPAMTIILISLLTYFL